MKKPVKKQQKDYHTKAKIQEKSNEYYKEIWIQQCCVRNTYPNPFTAHVFSRYEEFHQDGEYFVDLKCSGASDGCEADLSISKPAQLSIANPRELTVEILIPSNVCSGLRDLILLRKDASGEYFVVGSKSKAFKVATRADPCPDSPSDHLCTDPWP